MYTIYLVFDFVDYVACELVYILEGGAIDWSSYSMSKLSWPQEKLE